MKASIKTKLVILLMLFALVLIGLGVLVSGRVIDRMSGEYYMTSADELAATLARLIDADDARALSDDVMTIYRAAENKVTSEDWGSPAFDAYLEAFRSVEDTPAYRCLLAQLRRVEEVNSVDCLYLIAVDPELEYAVYLVDSSQTDACPPGCIDPIFEQNRRVLTDPDVGFPAYITNMEEYGWLVTSAAPVYDESGKLVCYAFVDISMEAIRAQRNQFLAMLAILLTGVTGIITLLAIIYVNRTVIRPMNMLSAAAAQYGRKGRDGSAFGHLNIGTGDEIEALYHSMVHMEQDINSYIDKLVKTREMLSSTEIRAERMNELAQKDALTGMRNKLAYNAEINRLNEALAAGEECFGIAVVDLNGLKRINDTYGHDRGDKAIIAVSRAACTTFAHSPVFRVGGDEFAVVLLNEDYQNRDALIRQFRETMAGMEDASVRPWERVSASIGAAVYCPGVDVSAEDVFRRADHEMYLEKEAYHARRAQMQ